jgi:hypothetical protein
MSNHTTTRPRRPARAAFVGLSLLGGVVLLATPAHAARPGSPSAPSGSGVLVPCTVPGPGPVRIGIPCDDPCNPVGPLCDPIPLPRPPLAP